MKIRERLTRLWHRIVRWLEDKLYGVTINCDLEDCCWYDYIPNEGMNNNE